MSDTQILPTPPTALLKAAHAQVRELFVRYAVLGAGEERAKRELFMEIQQALFLHLKVEEVLFYPAVRTLSDELAILVVLRTLQEHLKVKDLLDELLALSSEHGPLDLKMAVLRDGVLEHFRLEEEQVFPCAKNLSEQEQRALSRDMERLRVRLLGMR